MTEPPLTPRMQRICSLVPPCGLLIEVGADNAYMSEALLLRGAAKHVIASDVNDGPLARAAKSRILYGAEDVLIVKSDGLAAGELREAAAAADGDTCVLIAGMGGALIRRILRECTFTGKIRTLVLAPQSEQKEVRAFLAESGWRIEAEVMEEDDGKFYPALRAVHGTEMPAPVQLAFGPCLLSSKDPVLRKFLGKRRAVTERILAGLAKDGAHPERTAELERELALIKEAEAFYEMQGTY